MARKTRTTRISRKSRTPAAAPVSPALVMAKVKRSARRALDAGIQATTSVREAAIAQVEKTRKAAMAQVRRTGKAAASQVETAKSRTVEAVNHLERVFESRVAKAISKMGIPSTRDINALSRQVTQLQASVERLRRSRARTAA